MWLRVKISDLCTYCYYVLVVCVSMYILGHEYCCFNRFPDLKLPQVFRIILLSAESAYHGVKNYILFIKHDYFIYFLVNLFSHVCDFALNQSGSSSNSNNCDIYSIPKFFTRTQFWMSMKKTYCTPLKLTWFYFPQWPMWI